MPLFDYEAGTLTSGSVTVSGRVFAIRIFAVGQDSTYNLNGGDTINLRANVGMDINIRAVKHTDVTINHLSGQIDYFVHIRGTA